MPPLCWRQASVGITSHLCLNDTPYIVGRQYLPPEMSKQNIQSRDRVEATRGLVTKRAWLNPEGASEAELKKRTLTNLYNERPTWLDLAHKKLDRAVPAAYGWPHDIGDEEILERLLALNLRRVAGGFGLLP